MHQTPSNCDPVYTPKHIIWAVRVAARKAPYTSSLTRAIAGHILLAKAGYESVIRMGVLKEQEGRMKAHVWLEYNRQPVQVKPKEKRFVFLPGQRDRAARSQYTDKAV